MSSRNESTFVCLDLSTAAGQRRLRSEVASQDGMGDSAIAAPAERLLQLIQQGRCRTAVLERDYIDLDHRAALVRFYRLRHRDTRPRCTRVHLFGSQVTDRDLANGIAGHADAYRGFLVLRPFSHETLGRCVLSGALVAESQLSFVTCKARYNVHLAGTTIPFEGAPWMQQDRMVAACASAAMWVGAWHLGHFLGSEHRIYTTPEITELSTQYNLATGRAMPSGGLNTDQMANGFRAMGYEPILVGESETPTAALARKIVYAYVESGIPAILSLSFPLGGGHAITVVGHSLNTKAAARARSFRSAGGPRLSYYDASQFVPSFLAQDDAGGPFRSIEFLAANEWKKHPTLRGMSKGFQRAFGRLRSQFTCGVLIDRGTKEPEFGFLQSILIPSPPRVTLGCEDAQSKALALLATCVSHFRDLSGGFVLRTYLRRSNAFKEYCRAVPGLSPENVQRLCWHPMPKWVWVTEVADRPNHQTEGDIAGLMIQDAAGHIEAEPMEDLIALLTPELLVLGHPDSADPNRDAERYFQRQPIFGRFQRGRDGH